MFLSLLFIGVGHRDVSGLTETEMFHLSDEELVAFWTDGSVMATVERDDADPLSHLNEVALQH